MSFRQKVCITYLVSLQELQPLSVQAAEMIFEDSRSLIPTSQGLLATTDKSHKTSVFLPANEHPQSEPAAQVCGMKFLNLRLSPKSSAASNYPSTQIVTTTKPETHSGLKWADDNRTRYSVPNRPLSLISLPRATQPRTEKSERTRVQEFPLLPSVTSVHASAPVQGIRLLRYPSGPQGNITFPKIAPAPSSRPCSVIAAPIGEVPMLKLLHIESGVKMARNTFFFMCLHVNLHSYLCSAICHRCRPWCLLQHQWLDSSPWRKSWRLRLGENRMLKRLKSSSTFHIIPQLPQCQAVAPAGGKPVFLFMLFIFLDEGGLCGSLFMLHLQAEEERGERGKVKNRGHIQTKWIHHPCKRCKLESYFF